MKMRKATIEDLENKCPDVVKLLEDSLAEINDMQELLNYINEYTRIDFIVFYDDDIKFDFKDECDYGFVLLNNSSNIITIGILNKVSKLINIILKYWNEMKD